MEDQVMRSFLLITVAVAAFFFGSLGTSWAEAGKDPLSISEQAYEESHRILSDMLNFFNQNPDATQWQSQWDEHSEITWVEFDYRIKEQEGKYMIEINSGDLTHPTIIVVRRN